MKVMWNNWLRKGVIVWNNWLKEERGNVKKSI